MEGIKPLIAKPIEKMLPIHVYEKGNVFVTFKGCDFAHFTLRRRLTEKAGAETVEKVLPMTIKKKKATFFVGLRASDTEKAAETDLPLSSLFKRSFYLLLSLHLLGL